MDFGARDDPSCLFDTCRLATSGPTCGGAANASLYISPVSQAHSVLAGSRVIARGLVDHNEEIIEENREMRDPDISTQEVDCMR